MKSSLYSENADNVARILYCFGVCLRHLTSLDHRTLAVLSHEIFVTVARFCENEMVVNNGLSCLIQAMKLRGGISEADFSKDFSSFFRSILTSPRHSVTRLGLEFLNSLLSMDEEHLACRYLYEMGLAEFVFDLVTPNRPYLSELCNCLSALIQKDPAKASVYLPQAMGNIILIIKEERINLALDYCGLLSSCFSRYCGVPDMFPNTAVQDDFLAAMGALVRARGRGVFLAGLYCLHFFFRHNRLVEPLPLKALASLLEAVSEGVRHFVTQSVGGRDHRILTKPNLPGEFLKDHKLGFSGTYIGFLLSVYRFLESLVSSGRLFEPCDWKNAFKKLTEMFFNKHLVILTNSFFNPAMDVTVYQSFLNLLGQCLLTVLPEQLLKDLFGTAAANFALLARPLIDLEMQTLMRRCVLFLLPLLYKILGFTQDKSRLRAFHGELESLSSRDNGRDIVEAPAFDSCLPRQNYFTGETDIWKPNLADVTHLTALLTVSASSLCILENDDSPGHFSERTEDIVQILVILCSGMKGINYTGFADLENLLKNCALNPAEISAAALLMSCVILNRSVTYVAPSSWSQQDRNLQSSITKCWEKTSTLPWNLIEQLILFPSDAGIEYLIQLPVFFTVELIITYNFITAVYCDPVSTSQLQTTMSQGWSVLASSLVHRLKPHHTDLLLRCPGFARRLQRPETVWIKLSQKMILQCHSEDSLYLRKTPLLLCANYASLSNVWTVWLAALMHGDNAEVIRRLSCTFQEMLRFVETNKDQVQSEFNERSDRVHLEIYISESISSWSKRLHYSQSEFFRSRDELCGLYLKMLEDLIESLPGVFSDASRTLRIIQQTAGLLQTDLCERNLKLREQILNVFLRCLETADEVVVFQVIKIFCSNLRTKSLQCFYVEDGTSELTKHCERHNINGGELETIISLGAMILASAYALPSPAVSKGLLDKTIFTSQTMMLSILKSTPPCTGSIVAHTSAMMCIMMAFECSFVTSFWPSKDNNACLEFNSDLALCLYTFLMNPTEDLLRYLSIKTYGLLLGRNSLTCTTGGFSLNNLIFDGVWNQIVIEQLQVGVLDNHEIPLSVQYLEFITALLSTNDPSVLICLKKPVLQKLLLIYTYGSEEYSTEVRNALRRFAMAISSSSCLNILSERDRLCLKVKTEELEEESGQINTFDLFRTFLRAHLRLTRPVC
ncbi:unnamed protein product [Calicophoron daubneyi]|uniref:Uncharacterized protein n=1 Tax=Calicophoron daubneyi TaxID=300641 RepID=A0AAV2TYG0_CALDB